MRCPGKKKKKIKRQNNLTSYAKCDSKWITDINIKHKTIKLLKENTGEMETTALEQQLKLQKKKENIEEKLDGFGFGNGF